MSNEIVPKKSIRELLEKATTSYEKALQKDEEALSYLESRGITKEARDYFRLGVVRRPISGHEKYTDRISLPYITPSGVVSMRFRIVGDPGERAKLLGITGDISRPYNTRALVGNRKIYICEGESDVHASWMSDLPPVGFPGVHSIQKFARVYRRMFNNYEAIVLADNDDSGEGQQFADDLYRLIGSRSVLMPEGYDVAKFYEDNGPEALQRYVKKALEKG